MTHLLLTYFHLFNINVIKMLFFKISRQFLSYREIIFIIKMNNFMYLFQCRRIIHIKC